MNYRKIEISEADVDLSFVTKIFENGYKIKNENRILYFLISNVYLKNYLIEITKILMDNYLFSYTYSSCNVLKWCYLVDHGHDSELYLNYFRFLTKVNPDYLYEKCCDFETILEFISHHLRNDSLDFINVILEHENIVVWDSLDNLKYNGYDGNGNYYCGNYVRNNCRNIIKKYLCNFLVSRMSKMPVEIVRNVVDFY